MTAAWIMLAIDRALPNLTGGERDRVAREVLESIPPEPIALAIRESCATVLKQRGIRDEGGEMSREIGNNAGQSVLFTLAGFDEDEEKAVG